MSAITHLERLIGEVMDLRHAADLIEWDERVYMPPGGVTVHGEMSAALRRLAHEKFTSAEVGDALSAATAAVAGANPDGTPARLVSVIGRDYARATRVPADFVAEHAAAVSAARVVPYAAAKHRQGDEDPGRHREAQEQPGPSRRIRRSR